MTSLQPLYGFLAADISPTDSTIEVDDPSLLLGTDQIAILSPERERVEIMTVTGGSGTHISPWIVSRGQRFTDAAAHYKGAKVQGVNFKLRLDGPGGTPYQDYTFRHNNLVITDVAPGGFESLTFERFIAEPVVIPSLGSLVTLSRSTSATPGIWTDQVVWNGILEEPAPHWYPSGGALVEFTAVGYSHTLSDVPRTTPRQIPDTGDASGNFAFTIAQIIKTQLADLCILISPDYSHITGGGQAIQGKSADLLGKNTQATIGEYVPIGDAFQPLIYGVRTFGSDQAPKFELKLKPGNLRYRINLEDTVDGVRITTRRSDVYTAIMLRWREGVVQFTNQTARHAIGNVDRMLYIDASSVISDMDSANGYVKTLGAQLCAVKPKAGEVRMKLTKPVYDIQLAANAEPWDVLPGYPLDIYKGGAQLSSGNSDLSYADGFFIRSKRIEFAKGEITLATTDEVAALADMLTKATLTEMKRTDSPNSIPSGPIWSNPSSPTLPIPAPVPPSMRLSKGQDGAVAYEDLAEGTDTLTAKLDWSGGGGTDNPTAVSVGEDASSAVHTPMLLHTATVRVVPVDPTNTKPTCTIELYKIGVTVADDGTTTTSTPTLFDTIAINEQAVTPEAGSLGGFVLKKRREYKPAIEMTADDWILGRVSANDETPVAGVNQAVRSIAVSIHAGKLTGKSTIPASSSGVGIVTKQGQRGGAASPSAPAPGATFTIVTSDFARVQIVYGTESGVQMGWSPLSPLGKQHVLTIPSIPAVTIYWDIYATDQFGNQIHDAGNILF